MSAENVEVIRRMNEAFFAGGLETARAALHPDVEWHEPPDQPDQPDDDVHRGHAGTEDSIRNWTGAWEDWRYELVELIDLGERVLSVGRQSGRGKGSQVEVSSDLFHLWTLRDGKVVEARLFMHRDQAFEAAGLSDEGSRG